MSSFGDPPSSSTSLPIPHGRLCFPLGSCMFCWGARRGYPRRPASLVSAGPSAATCPPKQCEELGSTLTGAQGPMHEGRRPIHHFLRSTDTRGNANRSVSSTHAPHCSQANAKPSTCPRERERRRLRYVGPSAHGPAGAKTTDAAPAAGMGLRCTGSCQAGREAEAAGAGGCPGHRSPGIRHWLSPVQLSTSSDIWQNAHRSAPFVLHVRVAAAFGKRVWLLRVSADRLLAHQRPADSVNRHPGDGYVPDKGAQHSQARTKLASNRDRNIEDFLSVSCLSSG